MDERDPEELSRALEREADELAHHGEEVEGAVKETREDWERKRRDESVPGAPPPKGEEDSSVEADTEARREG